MEQNYNIWSKLSPKEKEQYFNLYTNSDLVKTIDSIMFKVFHKQACDILKKYSDKQEHKNE